jgi:hypothetical protein
MIGLRAPAKAADRSVTGFGQSLYVEKSKFCTSAAEQAAEKVG